MYISIERNAKGNLEVEEKILNKLINFEVLNNASGVNKVESTIGFHQETTMFVLVKLFLKTEDEFKIDLIKLNNNLNDFIFKTLKIKPKNIAFSYIK